MQVYYHGGGWVIGSSWAYHFITMHLCHEARAIVVSVDYRRAPEDKFPAAADDALYALRYGAHSLALVRVHSLTGIESNRSAGYTRMPLRWEAIQHVSWSLETRLEYETRLDSSSLLSTLADTIGWHQGNLAAVTALQARDLPLEPPLLVQALIYPVTNYSFDTPTYARYGTRYGLDADWMRWFWYDHDHDHEQQPFNPLMSRYRSNYLNNATDGRDPRASPLQAADLSRLPPALVIQAECDVLRSEGEAYVARLKVPPGFKPISSLTLSC